MQSMEEIMRRTLVLGAALLLVGPLLVGQAAAAGTAAPQMKWAQSAASEGSLVAEAGWYCRKWRHKCTKRWGWKSGRYYRCLHRHGC
jgi:hypothetical protein